MKGAPTAIQQLEFDRLRAFVAAGVEYAFQSPGLPAEQHPVAIVDRMWVESPATALRGLREAAGDIVEMLQDLDGDALEAFERRLSELGAPPLAAMRVRRVTSVLGILNRGEIRDDDEWRLINAVVSDMSDGILDEANRSLAQRLLCEYEASKGN